MSLPALPDFNAGKLFLKPYFTGCPPLVFSAIEYSGRFDMAAKKMWVMISLEEGRGEDGCLTTFQSLPLAPEVFKTLALAGGLQAALIMPQHGGVAVREAHLPRNMIRTCFQPQEMIAGFYGTG
jgi:hypothetical protein